MILLVVAIFIGLIIWQAKKQSLERNAYKLAYEKLLTAIPNFKAGKFYISKDNLMAIAIDVAMGKIVMGRRITAAEKLQLKKEGKPASLTASRSANFENIMKCEVMVDGQTVSSKPAGGALVGSPLFGTTGAVAGSNTGKTKYFKNINSISLKLLLRGGISDTSFELPFYQRGVSAVGSSTKARQECQLWADIVSAAMDRKAAPPTSSAPV